jgi:hypothetical protein
MFNQLLNPLFLVFFWFGVMNGKILSESFSSADDLKKSLEAFVEEWNLLHAHQFCWTYTGEGLHEKAVIRFTKILKESADKLETRILTKQLGLMKNLLENYLSKIPEDTVQIFIDTLQSKRGILEEIIQNEKGPTKKEKGGKRICFIGTFFKK